ncbi:MULTISPECIES: acyl carrier protein [Streptomyces]|uniref:Acyl carrier protein n=1 Tax=Streptomyces apricus TaxID=1828112 RepID=A0A5B0BLK5_9ACTN|nr:acyl carrier protein [Streptomyces apricus]KAA0942496.1 acyl carrier protein [Streptomyces apricus]
MNDTYERVVRLLVRNFGFETGDVSPADTFSELELDSLALVELTLAVQQEFGVKLTDDDLGAQSTLEEAVKVIESKPVAA